MLYKILGGENLGGGIMTAQYLATEDGKWVQRMDEVITAIEDVPKLRAENIVLKNRVNTIRKILCKEME
jgi:hypothetical protein